MITSPSMGLKQWDQPNDIFSYVDLAANFGLIDNHDHTSGKGVQVPTGGIANLAVDATKIADSSVSTAKIQSNAVTNTKILDTAVTTGKINDGAVTLSKHAKDGLGMGTGAFRAYVSGSATYSNNAIIVFPNEVYDLNNWYDTATGKYTPLVKGVYHVVGAYYTTSAFSATVPYILMNVFKNGVINLTGPIVTPQSGTTGWSTSVTGYVDMNGTTDFLTMNTSFSTGGGPTTLNISAGPAIGAYTWFCGALVTPRT